MSVTIQQLAESLGVSSCTVSRILNGRSDDYRPETCRKVVEGARRLGYRANQSARAMRRGKFGCITLLSSDVVLRSVIGGRLLESICRALDAVDNHLALARLPDDKLLNDKFIYSFLQRWYSDGLLVNYNVQVLPALETALTENQIPHVWINRKLDADAVHPDDLAIGRQAAAHLLARGYRNLAVFNTSGDLHYSAADRLTGARDRAAADGVTVRNHTVPGGPDSRLEIAEAFLAEVDPPAGVLAYTPSCAWGLYRAATRRQLRVPEDVAIITVAETAPQREDILLSYIELPSDQIGAAAVDLLLRKIKMPQAPQSAISFAGELKQGMST